MDAEQLNGRDVDVFRLLSGIELTTDLAVPEMRVTRVRAMRDDALFDIFGKLYDEFQGNVFLRLRERGIAIDGMFFEGIGKISSHSYSAPLGMFVDPLTLGLDRTPLVPTPHYVRFNTEECVRLPPTVDYSGLNKVMDAYVSEVDSDFVSSARPNQFREWKRCDLLDSQ
jgi:hypothetical protein